MLIHHFLPHTPTEQSSVAVAFTTTTAPQNVAALFAFMFAAAMITGFFNDYIYSSCYKRFIIQNQLYM
jgi:hypothetical protein